MAVYWKNFWRGKVPAAETTVFTMSTSNLGTVMVKSATFSNNGMAPAIVYLVITSALGSFEQTFSLRARQQKSAGMAEVLDTDGATVKVWAVPAGQVTGSIDGAYSK